MCAPPFKVAQILFSYVINFLFVFFHPPLTDPSVRELRTADKRNHRMHEATTCSQRSKSDLTLTSQQFDHSGVRDLFGSNKLDRRDENGPGRIGLKHDNHWSKSNDQDKANVQIASYQNGFWIGSLGLRLT